MINLNFQKIDLYLNIKKLFLKENIKKIIIISGLIGIGLIFISNMVNSKKASKEENIEITSSASDYIKNLEANIQNIVSSISGAGESKVLITLENSLQNVYATEQKKNNEAIEDKENENTSKKKETSDLETKYIKIKDENGAEKALSVTQIQPTVKGVVIVCNGGDNPVVQKKIIDAVKTALNITSKRVYVTK